MHYFDNCFSVHHINLINKGCIENIGTTISKVVANVSKEINLVYKSLKCPNCVPTVNHDIEKCEYYGETLIKTGQFK